MVENPLIFHGTTSKTKTKGVIKKMYLRNMAGVHDHGVVGISYKNGDEKVFQIVRQQERYTAFENSYAAADTMVHEFTHAVAEEMAHNYRVLGFMSQDDFYNTLRSEAYRSANKAEPTYDGRKWKDRANEFPAIQVENIYLGREYGYQADEVSTAALKALKRYWKQYNAKRK